MAPRLKSKGIMKFSVIAISLLMIVVFAFTFSGSTSLNNGNALAVTPNVVQNSTVYKFQWVNDTSSSAPPSVSNSTMACFTPDKEVVMFGGLTVANETVVNGNTTSYKIVNKTVNNTWMYNTQTWTKLATSSSIPGLQGSTMSFYPRGEDIVLFGGQNITSSGKMVLTNQTWIFTGFAWTPLKGLVKAPSARAFGASAYSDNASSIFLFGGLTNSGFSNSTWAFKDNSWTKLATTGAIPAMEGSTMQALPDGNILLYGGYNGSYSNSTWMLNVTTNHWSNLNLKHNPGHLGFSHLKDFSYNNFLLLYGGVNSKGAPTNNSWKFSPTTMSWKNMNIGSPSPQFGQSLSILNSNNTIVLFGGTSGNHYGAFSNYTYQFQNNTFNWVEFQESGLPANATWGVTLGSNTVKTTSNEVEFLIMAGTYDYKTIAPSGYTSQSGNITMYASFITQSISFSKIPSFFYYTYGLIAGIIIIIVTYLGSIVYKKIIK